MHKTNNEEGGSMAHEFSVGQRVWTRAWMAFNLTVATEVVVAVHAKQLTTTDEAAWKRALETGRGVQALMKSDQYRRDRAFCTPYGDAVFDVTLQGELDKLGHLRRETYAVQSRVERALRKANGQLTDHELACERGEHSVHEDGTTCRFCGAVLTTNTGPGDVIPGEER